MDKRQEGPVFGRPNDDGWPVGGQHHESTGNSALDAMLRAREDAGEQNDFWQAHAPAKQEPQPKEDFQIHAAAAGQMPAVPPVSFDDFAPQIPDEIWQHDDDWQQDEWQRAEMAGGDASGSKKGRRAKKTGKAAKKKKGRKAPVKKIVLTLVLIAVVLAGAVFGYTYGYGGIHFGLKAGAVKVGGMSVSEAEKAIDKAGDSLLHGQAITLTIYDTDYEIDVASVATGLDSEQSAQAAYDYTHSGSAVTRVSHALSALFGQGESPLSVSVDDEALSARLDEIAAEALTEPVDPSWTVEGDYLVIDTGRPGVKFDRDAMASEVKEKIRTMDFQPIKVDVTTSDPAAVDVDQIAAEAKTAPKNATVDKTDGSTILPSVDGVEFDVEEAKQIVGDGSEQTYQIPITRTPAEITAEDLAQVLFRDTLASTSTNLNEGNRSRTNNVRLACQYINGTILNPGEEFSYNGVVGERTPERGFQSAGAYANGQLIDEVGGGVCQPSSTLYMAVLRADLEVTERHNHSLTVSYTPLGEDATVSWGGPDFRFKNNTDYPIKIQASQSDGAMYIAILGTKTSDKKVTLKTEVLETLSYETIEKTDSSLSPGERRTEQTGATGYKTVTYKTVTENGQSTTTKANNSYYKKRDKIVLVGPAASSTPSTGSSAATTPSTAESGGAADPEGASATPAQ